MCECLNISGIQYYFVYNYKEDEKLRRSLTKLAEKTFGCNFEEWYKAGYWGDGYIPYSLRDGDEIVANVSVSVMNFNVLGEEKRYVQIGTVMTDVAYRGQGLSRVLIERVLEEWEANCDMIYLFANDSVLDFYPKFGFVKESEYQYSKDIGKKERLINVRVLDMSKKEDVKLLDDATLHTQNFAKLMVCDNRNLIMFYAMSIMKDNIYYLEEYEAAVVAEYKDETLYLQEIFSQNQVELECVIQGMLQEETKKVVLGFTPIDSFKYEERLLKEGDTTLFIKEGKENPFRLERLMFPVLSHA